MSCPFPREGVSIAMLSGQWGIHLLEGVPLSPLMESGAYVYVNVDRSRPFSISFIIRKG